MIGFDCGLDEQHWSSAALVVASGIEMLVHVCRTVGMPELVACPSTSGTEVHAKHIRAQTGCMQYSYRPWFVHCDMVLQP